MVVGILVVVVVVVVVVRILRSRSQRHDLRRLPAHAAGSPHRGLLGAGVGSSAVARCESAETEAALADHQLLAQTHVGYLGHEAVVLKGVHHVVVVRATDSFPLVSSK